jgi:3-oxoadipate enol-lactonase
VAARVPERIERLIVCCSSAHPDPTGAYRARAATVRTRGVERIADTVVARWFTPRFLSTSPRVVERMRRGLVATPREGYSGCCEAIAAVDLRAELPLIKASTLVIAGREDLATPPEHGYLIAERVEHARLELIPHAAHLANVEQPELVAKLMLRHLQ